MIGKLTTCLRTPHVSSRQAADAIKHLLHLQAEGARATLHLNPVKLYLEAQVRHGGASLCALCIAMHIFFVSASVSVSACVSVSESVCRYGWVWRWLSMSLFAAA